MNKVLSLIILFCLEISFIGAQKKALIIGITGQDGSYLAEFLLDKQYEVHGMVRRSSSHNTERIDHIISRITLHYGDVTDSSSVQRTIKKIEPDEIYNLAAQSHVAISFEMPQYTAAATGIGTLNILDAITSLGLTHKTKFYQASTSELYGKVQTIPQTETTCFYPRSPYGVAKLYAYWITVNYRESYNLFACNGILFNHESPRRGENFVTRKITKAATRIKAGLQDRMYLGNLDAQRDWGYAKDYVEAMWLILQQEKAEDWVIATGETHSVREFVERVFQELTMNITWQGEGLNEIGIDAITGKTIIAIDPSLFRPAEVDQLIGNAHKAHTCLGWRAHTSFEELVKIMVDADLKLLHA